MKDDSLMEPWAIEYAAAMLAARAKGGDADG